MSDRIQMSRLEDAAHSIFLNTTTLSGVCCCGDNMNNHSDPMSCGHSPVDSGEYAVQQWIDEYDKARTNGSIPADMDQGPVGLDAYRSAVAVIQKWRDPATLLKFDSDMSVVEALTVRRVVSAILSEIHLLVDSSPHAG